MHRRVFAIAGGIAVVAPIVLLAQGTFAAWSDYGVVANRAQATVWAPDPPAACGPVSDYDGGVVYLTAQDDVWPANGEPPTTNHRQIVMGYGGNDTIYAGNSGDCIVGGPGNDKLYGGNAKDIVIGGDGDDLLAGGNGVDTLDGGSGTDTCVGGHAPDVTANCESLP